MRLIPISFVAVALLAGCATTGSPAARDRVAMRDHSGAPTTAMRRAYFDSDAGTLTGQCGALVPNGSVVTLTATPLEGWTFVGWSGEDRDCDDGVLTMDAAKRCVATFVQIGG